MERAGFFFYFDIFLGFLFMRLMNMEVIREWVILLGIIDSAVKIVVVVVTVVDRVVEIDEEIW